MLGRWYSFWYVLTGLQERGRPMVAVKLEWHEYAMAAEVGKLRQLSSIRQGLKHKYGMPGAGWTEHIEGACGELAVAKVLGIYWDGSVNTFKNLADLRGNVEVRTRSRNDWDLIVRPDDNDFSVYVLVTGMCPDYNVVGWIPGIDAKRQEWLQTHGGRSPAYFVPQHALASVAKLADALDSNSSA